MKNIIYLIGILFLGVFLIHKILMNDNVQNNNLYILHTKMGDVRSNYHNSRDLNNGWMYYYKGQDEQKIQRCYIDSVTILSENFWTCGPRDENLKYIDKRTK